MNFEKMTVSKNLNFRINEKGEILGRISKSADEFVFSLEIIELLKKIQTHRYNGSLKESQELETHLKKNLKSTYENSPRALEINKILNELCDEKIVVKEDYNDKSPSNLHGFSDPWIQWAMLADTRRCTEYFNALKTLVLKDKTCILDLGAGTGLLSYMALKLGAKKAYLVEQGNISDYIPKLFKKLGISKNRYEIFKKNSKDMSIPKDTNMIVHELFGNDPFEEGLLDALSHLESASHLKDITFLPQSLDVFFSFVEIKKEFLNSRMLAFYDKNSQSADPSIREFLSLSKKVLPFDSLSFPFKLDKNSFNHISEIKTISHLNLIPPIKTNSISSKFKMEIKRDCQYVFGLLWFKSKLTKEKPIMPVLRRKILSFMVTLEK